MTGSHTGSDQWQSFEVRMRRRRFERCLIKADVALEGGFLADAREAIEEARRLDPHAPELVVLNQRAAAREQQGDAPPRARRLWIPVAATALFLAALATLHFWLRPIDTQPLTPTPAAPDRTAPAPLRPVTTDRPLLKVATDDVTAPEIRPELEPLPVGTTAAGESREVPALGSLPATPLVDSGVPRDTPLALATAPAPALPPPVEPPRPESRAELPRDTRDVALVNTLPAPPASPPAPVPDAVPAANDGGAAPAVNAINEDQRVRAVLGRYETAYSTLDAAAAGAVYPRIDRAALARAFDGLEAQHFSLGSCSVNVAGATASAECSGSASWRPKVGGGTRTQARRWQFELRQTDGAWRIVDARVR